MEQEPQAPATDTETEAAPVAASELLEQVLAGAQAYQELSEAFLGSFNFDGRPLSEYVDEMEVQIPPDCNPAKFRELMAEVAGKTQRCYSNYSIANTMNKALHGGGNMKKSDLVALLVEQYARQNRKRPAAAVLDRVADSLMKNTVSTAVATSIMKDFWSDRIESLERTRKVLESIGMSIASEMKFTST